MMLDENGAWVWSESIASGGKWLIPSVIARPLQGEPPTIDLVMGYNKSNTSPLLKRVVARADELVAGVQKQNSFKSVQPR
jgi:LysR family hca operon transcriptional activator